MARINRDEWLSNIGGGKTISVTFPGESSPVLGKVVARIGDEIIGEFVGQRWRFGAVLGELRGYSSGRFFAALQRRWKLFLARRRRQSLPLLQPVAIGSGGSVAPRILLSNVLPGRSSPRNVA